MTATSEQLFPTVTVEVSEALQNYIYAETPRGYVKQEYEVRYNSDDKLDAKETSDVINKTAGFVAFCGLVPVAIASVDYLATADDESGLNPNEYRDANANTMDAWISGVEDDVARHPNEVTVCRDTCSSSRSSGTKTDIYDVSQRDGLSRYLTDQVSVADQLNPAQKEALTTAINHEANGPRLPETDQQQIVDLHNAVNSYVATVPERKPVTTNDNTGELFVGGSLLIFASLAVGAVLGKRQRRQIKRFQVARTDVSELINSAGSAGNWRERNRLERIATAAGYDRSASYDKKAQPKGGGKKRRHELIEATEAVILAQEEADEKSAA